jgi:hypothetical protein
MIAPDDFIYYPVFQVTVETISFFYKKNGAGFLLCRWFKLFLRVIHHFCKASPPVC